jgi:hypothetical protein
MFKDQKDHQYGTYSRFFRRETLDSDALIPLFQPKKRETKRKMKQQDEEIRTSSLRFRRMKL